MDEDRFNKLMEKTFELVLVPRTEVIDYTMPGNTVEIDNIGQKGTVVFVFEGTKSKKADIGQLRLRFRLLHFNRTKLIADEVLGPFSTVRVFGYNFKIHALSEYNEKGEILKTWKFDDDKQLAEILSKL